MKLSVLLLLFILLPTALFAQQPYSEKQYERLYKEYMQRNTAPVNQPQNLQVRPVLYYDKIGDRIVEGFVNRMKVENGKERFSVLTKYFGNIKVELSRASEITPSKTALKEGEYVIVKQHRDSVAKSVDVLPVWDAKKRPMWFDSPIRK